MVGGDREGCVGDGDFVVKRCVGNAGGVDVGDDCDCGERVMKLFLLLWLLLCFLSFCLSLSCGGVILNWRWLGFVSHCWL